VLLLAGALAIANRDGGRHFEAAGSVPTEPGVPSTTPGPSGSASATRGSADVPTVVLVDRSFTPTRLAMTRPAVQARVTPVRVERDGSLDIPADVREIGWWDGGAAPGSPVGTVVLAGHVDSASAGAGALFRLDQTEIGSRITLAGDGRTQTYVVDARRRYPKAELPGATLFAQGERPRLVLITCGGAFDRRTRHYTDNVVVFATPVS
jgi:hypothetical protein